MVLFHLQDKDVFEGALEPAFLVLMDKLKEKLDPDDDEMRFLKIDLCFLLRQRCDYAAAQRYGLHFLAVAERVHGRYHAATRGLLLKLGDIYLHQKLYSQAIYTFNDVLSRTYDVLGENTHFAGVYAYRNLGGIYEELNDRTMSEYHWKAVVGAALHYPSEDEHSKEGHVENWEFRDVLDRKFAVAQLSHYGLHFAKSATKDRVLKLFKDRVLAGKCDRVPPEVQTLEAELEAQYVQLKKAQDAKRKQWRMASMESEENITD